MAKTASASRTLAQSLAKRIRREGPITFRDWMEAALYDEQQGYYCQTDLIRWGRQGDYRTSPQTSALFASTFARYFAQLFEKLGSPQRLTIVEVGCGAGNFAAELLETLRSRFPKIFESTIYILDEISSDARMRAAERVALYKQHVQFRRLSELKSIDAGIIFSNELLDAFPVHRVRLCDGELAEMYVEVDADNRFGWRDGPLSTPRLLAYLERFHIQLRDDQVAEINLALYDWFQQVSEKLDRGFVVTVDYGAEAHELYDSSLRGTGTLRAFRHHQLASDILACPGEQDITSTIDLTAIKDLGIELGFRTCESQRQDRFLLQCGLLEEMELRVEEASDDAERAELCVGAREMILPTGMATSFHVLVQGKSVNC